MNDIVGGDWDSVNAEDVIEALVLNYGERKRRLIEDAVELAEQMCEQA